MADDEQRGGACMQWQELVLVAGRPRAERERIARDVLATLLESDRRRAVSRG